LHLGIAWLALVGTLQSPSATTRERARPTFVQGGVVVTRLFAGTPNHRVQPAFSGIASGVQAAFNWPVGRTADVGGEFTYGGSISKPQGWYYNWAEEYVTVNRDMLLTVAARFRPIEGSAIEVIGDAGLVFSRIRKHSATAIYTLTPPRPSERIPDRSQGALASTVSGGIDLPIRTSSRVAIVPGVRLRWVDRSQDTDNLTAYAGVGRISLQFSLNLRVTR
jgi:hypothetical protein